VTAFAETPIGERDRIWAGLKDGSIDVVCSVMIVSYGWDCPPVSCAILARPTKSLTLYFQMVGRVLRPWDGKHDAIILDHGDCTLRHGFVTDPVVWTLEDKPKKVSTMRSDQPKICPQCEAAFRGSRCPECGAGNELKHDTQWEAVEITPELGRSRQIQQFLERKWTKSQNGNPMTKTGDSRVIIFPGDRKGSYKYAINSISGSFATKYPPRDVEYPSIDEAKIAAYHRLRAEERQQAAA
jgi:superfamily II DNA or RNA helicase